MARDFSSAGGWCSGLIMETQTLGLIYCEGSSCSECTRGLLQQQGQVSEPSPLSSLSQQWSRSSMWKRLTSNGGRISNKPISPPSKALLLSAFCSLWPVLWVFESKEDDLKVLIFAAHQKHTGEGTKCCYYQKPTFEIKLHFIPYPLFDSPRQGAAREFKAPC